MLGTGNTEEAALVPATRSPQPIEKEKPAQQCEVTGAIVGATEKKKGT